MVLRTSRKEIVFFNFITSSLANTENNSENFESCWLYQNIGQNSQPDFEFIKKYFGTSGFVMQNLEDGWRLGGITLARPETTTVQEGKASPNK